MSQNMIIPYFYLLYFPLNGTLFFVQRYFPLHGWGLDAFILTSKVIEWRSKCNAYYLKAINADMTGRNFV